MIEKITPQIAALYIGQKCDLEWLITDRDDVFMAGEVWHDSVIIGATITRLKSQHIAIVPHLRPIESLTEFEARDLFEIATAGVVWEKRSESCLEKWWKVLDIEQYIVGHALIGSPLVWLKLLEWGFDLFGLILAGLAKEIPAQ